MRAYLRIEYAFNKIQQALEKDDQDNHSHAIWLIFSLIDYLQRNDVKSSVLKDLDARITEYVVLENNPQVDTEKLSKFLTQLKSLQSWIYRHQGKLGQHVTDNEFFSSIKKRFDGSLTIQPSDIPQYFYFLSRDSQKRREMIAQLLNEMQSIKTSINVLLRLFRESANFREIQAEQGGFGEDLDMTPCNLVRIRVNRVCEVYPEVSVGSHRVNIRFHTIKPDGKIVNVNDSIPFKLALCN